MELHYVEVENWNNLGDNDIVIFKLPKKQIKYAVAIITSVFCSNLNGDSNSEIFDYLNLDAETFTQNIVGYFCSGIWPRVKSLDDLKKVIKALDDECVKKFGECNTPKFKVGDKVRILPRKGDPEDYIGTYIDEMLHFVGKTATIGKIYPNSSISLVNNRWTWDPKALELIDKKEEPDSSTKKLEAIDSSTSINMDKPETQFEAEVNLFPTKKHYQLNFNY